MIRYWWMCLIIVMGWLCTYVLAGQANISATQPAVGELRPILSPQAKREAARQLIDRFVAHVNASEAVSTEARRTISESWKKHRNDEDVCDFLTAGVAIMSEFFKDGLTALETEDYALADEKLRPLIDSKDPYVSLHAAGLLARSLVEQDKLEEAEKILEPLATNEKELIDKSFLEVEVDFLLGYCQLSNLGYEKARATLQEFIRDHPDAPDQFLLPARQMLQELLARQPEHLGDVSDLMGYAARRLANGEAGKPVCLKQQKAVDLLTKLIAEAQQYEQEQAGKCKKCGGKGCKRCRGGRIIGNAPPGSPAQDSVLPGGQGRIGDLHHTPAARPGEQWGKMRPEQRERILQSLRKNFPSRYRQLIEQYYKQLAKEH